MTTPPPSGLLTGSLPAHPVESGQMEAVPSAGEWYSRALERLVDVVQELSLARNLAGVIDVVRHAARDLTGADGATFVLRDGDQCHYADEDAIAPLWKGKRFPMDICVSGWAMLHREPAVIEDIYADPRVPADAYRPTFVKSLVMVPIRTRDPVGAIGNYWAARRRPRPEEVKVLRALADCTSVALENAQLYTNLERMVAERTARLELANQELETYSYSVSHDLRAPLRHIRSYAEILQEDAGDALTSEAQRCLSVIKDSAQRMQSLIEALLEFSQSARAEIHGGPVLMQELVDEAWQETEAARAGRVIAWRVAALPEVTGDRALLRQVWANLISNALKYTRNRTEAKIEITAHRTAHEVEFAVRDNGAGFDPRFAARLFGPFQRLHSATEYEGSGIGLANVRRIVARHGGRTWAEGRVDQGATFHFTLPLSPGPA